MHLYTFIDYMQTQLRYFEEDWRAKNHDNPENFPIEMEKGNEGLWFEMFEIFLDENKK